MTKEQQDLAWQCLPKEAREEIKREYQRCNSGSYVEELLEDWFGCHNLTSDTEPTELLFVERKKVQELYEDYKNRITPITGAVDKAAYGGVLLALQELFGDKCLPDKESSVQGESNFKVGDKFRFKKNHSKVRTVKSILKNGRICFFEKDVDGLSRKFLVSPEYIEPYTEPKYKIGDEIIVVYGNSKGLKGVIKEYSEDDGTWAVILNGYNYPINFAEEWIEPYTESETKRKETQELSHLDEQSIETKDNMEEKELDLCELIKGCEGEEFYSPVYGIISIVNIRPEESRVCIDSKSSFGRLQLFEDGSLVGVGNCVLFPSRALYEKYPLDAYAAWMEWKSERTPKRWRAKEGKYYWFFDRTYTPYYQEESGDLEDTLMYDSYNYFRTKEEAQQAAEAVRESLMKFHEK